MNKPQVKLLPLTEVPDWARALFPEEPLLFIRTPLPLEHLSKER